MLYGVPFDQYADINLERVQKVAIYPWFKPPAYVVFGIMLYGERPRAAAVATFVKSITCVTEQYSEPLTDARKRQHARNVRMC